MSQVEMVLNWDGSAQCEEAAREPCSLELTQGRGRASSPTDEAGAQAVFPLVVKIFGKLRIPTWHLQ